MIKKSYSKEILKIYDEFSLILLNLKLAAWASPAAFCASFAASWAFSAASLAAFEVWSAIEFAVSWALLAASWASSAAFTAASLCFLAFSVFSLSPFAFSIKFFN